MGTFFLAYKRKIHPLGLPIIGGATFLFIYIVQPFYLIITKKIYYYLNNLQIAKAIFISFLCYVSFISGWFTVKNKNVRNIHKNNILWNYKKIYNTGLILSIFGTLGFLYFLKLSGGILHFYSGVHGAYGAWKETTAYLHMSRYYIFPGVSLMITGLLKGKLNRIYWVPIIFFTSLMYIHSILASSRGTFFAMSTTFVLTYYLAGGKIPKMKKVIIGGIILAISLALIVGYREYLHLGPKDKPLPPIHEALLFKLGVNDIAIRTGSTGDNEFLYHAGLIETVDRLNRYHFGLGWIYMVTVHLIPRIIWENKPYGWDTPGVTPYDIFLLFGWTRSPGSAPAIVADIYRNFGMFSLIFFFLLGLFSKKIFLNLLNNKDPKTITIYVLFYAWSLNMFAQGFGALIDKYLYVLIPSLLLLNLSKHRVTIIIKKYETIRT